jgi:lipoyl(octanoyl) transferase
MTVTCAGRDPEGVPAIVRCMVGGEAATDAHAAGRGAPLEVHWLGRLAYRDAWDLQKRLASARASGSIPDQLLLLEHPAVLTLGRQADETHVLATPAELAEHGIEVLRVERGGEVTYHGPGQLVAYPIIRLADRELLLRPFVRALEAALVATCAAHGVRAARREGHPGCWIDPAGPEPRKIGALGIRVERGTTYHGIALNVDVELAHFDLIDACGMPGVISTSIAREAGRPDERPSTAAVARAAETFAAAFADAIDARLDGADAASADPAQQRTTLDRRLAAVAATAA